MSEKVVPLRPDPVKCVGVSRDGDNPKAVLVHFSRPLADDDLRWLYDFVSAHFENPPPW